jgi:hypothetical protein
MKLFFHFGLVLLLLPGFFYNHSNKSTLSSKKIDTLKAQIDITILSGHSERYSKPFEKVKAGERFRIHIKPNKTNYLWIISASDEKAGIIMDTLINYNNFSVFPSKNEYYIFDGKNDIEKIIIILSFNKELMNTLKKLSDEDLLAFIGKLAESSKCSISEKGEPLINISGNLREISFNEKRMSKYQGLGYLVKEFKFNVKK